MNLDFKTPFSLFFGHPKWGMNWLLVTLCLLIPVVGPIVVVGWLMRCFVAWLDDRPFPEFDFNNFVEYLIYFVTTILVFAQWHLHFQVYRCYLARGGEEIAVDPGLRPAAAPPLPGQAPPASPRD